MEEHRCAYEVMILTRKMSLCAASIRDDGGTYIARAEKLKQVKGNSTNKYRVVVVGMLQHGLESLDDTFAKRFHGLAIAQRKDRAELEYVNQRRIILGDATRGLVPIRRRDGNAI